MMTDPIADLLTRIRNATHARKASVDMPFSREKERVARVLVAEGYLASATMVEAQPRNVLRIELRYDAQRRPVILGIRRVSRPSITAISRSNLSIRGHFSPMRNSRRSSGAMRTSSSSMSTRIITRRIPTPRSANTSKIR